MTDQSFVIVTATDYVTVTPTGFATIASSISPTFSSGTSSVSSSAGLSSSPISGSMSTPTSHAPSPTTTASLTAVPTLPSGIAEPVSPKPKFNETFAIVTLIAVIIMAVLLCALIGYMIYLCVKGECSKCDGLKDQLRKWERGDLKRITKGMVKEREALNDGPSMVAFSTVDLEKGVVEDTQRRTQSAQATALEKLEGSKKTPFWDSLGQTVQDAKGKVMGKGKKTVPSPIRTSEVEDRFFKVKIDSVHSVPPQPQVPDQPGNTHLYAPPGPTYSPSEYSQVTRANEPRAFADHTAPDMANPGRPRRDSNNQPVRYTAYMHDAWGPRDQEYDIQQAEAGFHTQMYQNAERAMQRDSTTDSDMHRALDVVNRADQKVHRAHHPSMLTDLSSPNKFEDVDIGNGNVVRESYQMPEWCQTRRKDGFF